MSELALLTACAPRDGLDDESRDVKIKKALFALRIFPVRR